MRPLGKVIACEISFVPVKCSDSSSPVNEVIEFIEKSGLEYSVGPMSTFLRGDRDKLFQLLKEIYTHMDEKCNFVISARISNICGCNLNHG